MNKKEFATFLHNARNTKGMTQSELSNITGFTDRAISLWERGGRGISLENAGIILNALGMEIIFKEKGEKI